MAGDVPPCCDKGGLHFLSSETKAKYGCTLGMNTGALRSAVILNFHVFMALHGVQQNTFGYRNLQKDIRINYYEIPIHYVILKLTFIDDATFAI